MKTFKQLLSVTLALLIALPARAVPGEIKLPLTGAQAMFQMFNNPGGGIPGGVPSLNLRNVRSNKPLIDVTVGGTSIKYIDLEHAIEAAIAGGAPNQGEWINLIGGPGDHDWCKLVYSVHPQVHFLNQPENLNVIENSPGHLTASFDTVVEVKIGVQANIFGVPVVGDTHVEADIMVMLAVHAKFLDVSVWPPNTNDVFVGNPPTLNPAHVELTLQQVGGNVELDGLQGPVAMSGFLISLAGLIAGPFTFGFSLILTVLGPFIAAAAPGLEEIVEDIMNQKISEAIAAGIAELDTQIRETLADSGNQIALANQVSNIAPSIFPNAPIINQYMNNWFGSTFNVQTRINNNFVAAGLTVKRNAGSTSGANSVPARIRFPKYKCEYEQGAYVETDQVCDGKDLWAVDIYEMKPKLVAVNADIVGKSCGSFFTPDIYSKSYLGSDWSPPNAVPTFQTLASTLTGTNVAQVSSSGQTYYQCDLNVNSVPSNIILDFGAKAGSSLASRIAPKRSGPSLPTELAIDPAPFLGRVHMVVKPTSLPLALLNEDGLPQTTRSIIGAPGPQPGTLDADCPSYQLALDGAHVGVCSNPGSYESPCPDCY